MVVAGAGGVHTIAESSVVIAVDGERSQKLICDPCDWSHFLCDCHKKRSDIRIDHKNNFVTSHKKCDHLNFGIQSQFGEY